MNLFFHSHLVRVWLSKRVCIKIINKIGVWVCSISCNWYFYPFYMSKLIPNQDLIFQTYMQILKYFTIRHQCSSYYMFYKHFIIQFHNTTSLYRVHHKLISTKKKSQPNNHTISLWNNIRIETVHLKCLS